MPEVYQPRRVAEPIGVWDWLGAGVELLVLLRCVVLRGHHWGYYTNDWRYCLGCMREEEWAYGSWVECRHLRAPDWDWGKGA